MKIELDDKFYIQSNSNAFELFRRNEKKEGVERKTDSATIVGSYGTLDSALNGVC